MAANPKIIELKTLSCSASWRNYYFVKVTTADGVVGWSEFDEGFGSPGVGAVIAQLAAATEAYEVNVVYHNVDGHLVMPDRPGWGTEPIEEALLAHPPITAHGLMGNYRRPS